MRIFSDVAEILRALKLLWRLVSKEIRAKQVREALDEAIQTKDTTRLENLINSPPK